MNTPNEIHFAREKRSIYEQTNRRDLWHEGARRNTPGSRNGKRRKSRAATRNEALARKKPHDAPGLPSISPTKADGKKAVADAASDEARKARAKADAKAVGKRNGTKSPSLS